jgi:DNA polymerase-3 subunit alpha
LALSQKGTGYARFTIQDFTGSFQINLYNEKFESYKHLITKGQVLYIEGSNEKGYSQDRFFFNVKDIRMLDTIGKNMTKSVTVKLTTPHHETKNWSTSSNTYVSNEWDHTLLKLKVVDEGDDIGVDLVATAMKVTADYQFVNEVGDAGTGL